MSTRSHAELNNRAGGFSNPTYSQTAMQRVYAGKPSVSGASERLRAGVRKGDGWFKNHASFSCGRETKGARDQSSIPLPFLVTFQRPETMFFPQIISSQPFVTFQTLLHHIVGQESNLNSTWTNYSRSSGQLEDKASVELNLCWWCYRSGIGHLFRNWHCRNL